MTPLNRPEKFVVLGSNSFSGSEFVDYLLERGHSVYGISRSAEPDAVFLKYKRQANRDFKFFALDLNHHLNEIMAVMDDFRPDYIVNFAAQSMVAESWANPDHWMMTNVVSTVRLHEKLRIRKYLRKYVHVSTPEVYGTCHGTIPESTNYHPSTPYAVSRAACDMSLMTYFQNYGFPVVFTRAANVFGPGQQLYRIVPRTILYLKLKRKLQLHGGGHSTRSFIHISDVASGTYLAALQGAPGNIFHFSTSEQITIRNLVEKICDKMNVPFSDAVEVTEDRPGKDSAYLLDSSKAMKELGWKPTVSLNQGVDETIGWINRHFETLCRQELNYVHKS